MNQIKKLMLGTGIAFATVAAVAAHEVTYLGTVSAVNEGSIEVMVIDERSGTESAMSFRLTAETKISRGDVSVTLAEAAIQVDERVAVTVNTDVPGNTALALQLPGHEHH